MIRPTRSALVVAGVGVPVALLPALVSAKLWPVWAVALLLFALGASTSRCCSAGTARRFTSSGMT